MQHTTSFHHVCRIAKSKIRYEIIDMQRNNKRVTKLNYTEIVIIRNSLLAMGYIFSNFTFCEHRTLVKCDHIVKCLYNR